MNRRNRGESLLWMWSISMAIGGFCWFFQWEGSLSAVEDEGRLNSNLDMHINLRQRLALTSMTSFMTNISIFFFNRSKVWGISPKLTWTCQIGYPSLINFDWKILPASRATDSRPKIYKSKRPNPAKKNTQQQTIWHGPWFFQSVHCTRQVAISLDIPLKCRAPRRQERNLSAQ